MSQHSTTQSHKRIKEIKEYFIKIATLFMNKHQKINVEEIKHNI